MDPGRGLFRLKLTLQERPAKDTLSWHLRGHLRVDHGRIMLWRIHHSRYESTQPMPQLLCMPSERMRLQ